MPNATPAGGNGSAGVLPPEIEAQFARPGDRVRFNPRSRARNNDGILAHEASRQLFGHQILTVTSTAAVTDRPWPPAVYTFAEVPGKHDATVFMDSRGYVKSRGVLIVRDGKPWFVPGSGDVRSGPARPVAAEPTRSFRYFNLGAGGAAEFFSVARSILSPGYSRSSRMAGVPGSLTMGPSFLPARTAMIS